MPTCGSRSRRPSGGSPLWATKGWSCWPTCRTPGRPVCWRSGNSRSASALARHGLAISNVNGFMMNAVADPRQPYWHPSWIEPDPALPGHPPRAYQAGPAVGQGTRRPGIQTEPGGPPRIGQSWEEATQIFYDELMPCVEVAEELGVDLLIEPEPGLLIETLRAVPGVCRPDRFVLAGVEFRHRPRLLRGPGPARLDRPHGSPHPALSSGGHRRQPRPCPPRARPRRDRSGRDFASDPDKRLRRLADRRALSLRRESRRRRPRGDLRTCKVCFLPLPPGEGWGEGEAISDLISNPRFQILDCDDSIPSKTQDPRPQK